MKTIKLIGIISILLFIIIISSCSRKFDYNYAYITELKAVKEKYQKDTLIFAEIIFDRLFDHDTIDLELNGVKIYINKDFTNSKKVSGPLSKSVMITKYDGNMFCKFNEGNDSICIGGFNKFLKIKFTINEKIYIKRVDPSKGKWFIIGNYPPKRVNLTQHVRPPVFD
jgi:hypothetical protein